MGNRGAGGVKCKEALATQGAWQLVLNVAHKSQTHKKSKQSAERVLMNDVAKGLWKSVCRVCAGYV